LQNGEDAILWDKIIASEYGTIAPFIEHEIPVAPLIVFATLEEGIIYRRSEVFDARTKEISLIHGTNVDNLNAYESKLSRLTTVAQEMRINPHLFHGYIFNGVILTSIDSDIITIANSFISEQLIASRKIEEVIQKYDAILLQINNCQTIDEIINVSVI